MKPNYLLLISIVAILSLTASYFLKFSNWNFDDSYIVYRIVNNILEGNGWVYNIDEPYNASTSILNTILIEVASMLKTEKIFPFYISSNMPNATKKNNSLENKFRKRNPHL